MPEKIFFTVRDVTQMLSIGRTTFYACVASGRIKTVKNGKRTLIHADELRRYELGLLASGRKEGIPTTS